MEILDDELAPVEDTDNKIGDTDGELQLSFAGYSKLWQQLWIPGYAVGYS